MFFEHFQPALCRGGEGQTPSKEIKQRNADPGSWKSGHKNLRPEETQTPSATMA